MGDKPTAANSRIHSLPGSTATTPGQSTPAWFPSSPQRSFRRTSTDVRRPRGITEQNPTSSNSGHPADRPVLTIPLSLGPRNSLPADSSAEDSTTSIRPRQEPPAPPPTPRSQTTEGTASSFEYVPPSSHTENASSRDLQVSRYAHHTATDTPGDLDNIDHSPDALGNRSRSNRHLPDHATSHSTGSHHPLLLSPTATDPAHLPNTFLLGLHLGIFPVVHLGLYSRQRALQLRRTIYDVGEGQAFRRYSHPQGYYCLLGPCAAEMSRMFRIRIQL